jgi:hypothetical protein
MQGMPGGQMPEGFKLPEGFKMPTMVWVKDDKGIHPVPVELGSNDGDNTEVKSGLEEGTEVVTKMTIASAKEKKEQEVTPILSCQRLPEEEILKAHQRDQEQPHLHATDDEGNYRHILIKEGLLRGGGDCACPERCRPEDQPG